MPKGEYKRYLKDSNIDIPPSTVRRWEKIELEAQQENEMQYTEDYDNYSNLRMMNTHNCSSEDIIKNDSDEDSDEEFFDASDFSDLEDEEPATVNIDQENNVRRQVLYKGCNITLQESTQLIMAFALRFGLSDVALEHLLFLINSHLPTNTHHSLHTFLKNFPLPSNISTHFYCGVNTCQRLIQFDDSDVMHCECGALCQKENLKRNMCFFLTISLKEQLEQLLDDPTIRRSLRWQDESQSDVINGKVYKKLIRKGTISKRDITIQWNTDGVQLFKSSKIQLWPIQVSVNELPYRLRKDNILLCGLWYGPTKPNINTFLRLFVEECNMLHDVGFRSIHDSLQIKVHTLICSVDSMARPILQNIQTFRGAKGCSFCLHDSEEYNVGRGNARIYRGDVEILRTHSQHVTDCNEALRRQTIVNGIKGPSILLELKTFNIISSFVPEYMHCVLLGVVKTMMDWWTDSTNKHEHFYIGQESKINDIDNILLSIQPPSEITRIPRSLKDKKLWKASEWKNFILYYSLLSLSIAKMPKRYIQHWFLLVYSITIFLQQHISREDFKKATEALRKFVLSIESIYAAPQLMKFNFHLLLHIPKSVKDFGALWSVSAFPYEHYNGILAKMFRSSQAVPQQICKFYLRMQKLKTASNEIFNNNNSCRYAKNLYGTLLFNKKTCNNSLQYNESLRFLGAAEIITLNLIQKTVLENEIKESICDVNVRSYQRFIYNNILYHVEGYKRMKKRMNCIVQLQNKKIISITHIIMVNTLITNRSICLLLGLKMYLTDETLYLDRDINIQSNSFLHIIKKTNECVAIYPTMLMKKCVITPYANNQQKLCCFPLVNLVERD